LKPSCPGIASTLSPSWTISSPRRRSGSTLCARNSAGSAKACRGLAMVLPNAGQRRNARDARRHAEVRLLLISYGFESYSPVVLQSMKKHTTPDQIHSAIHATLDKHISIQGGFIFGDIAETLETAQETLDFLARSSGSGNQPQLRHALPRQRIISALSRKGHHHGQAPLHQAPALRDVEHDGDVRPRLRHIAGAGLPAQLSAPERRPRGEDFRQLERALSPLRQLAVYRNYASSCSSRERCSAGIAGKDPGASRWLQLTDLPGPSISGCSGEVWSQDRAPDRAMAAG